MVTVVGILGLFVVACGLWWAVAGCLWWAGISGLRGLSMCIYISFFF